MGPYKNVNVSPPELEPIMTNKFQFLDKSGENVAKIIKIPNIGRYRYMGAIRRSGPAQTIFCLRLQYPLRTSNSKFETIPVNKFAKNIKIPNIGRYRYMGALRRPGPAQTIFCHRLQYSLRTSNIKFETIPVNNVA